MTQNESRIHSIALLHRMLYNDEVSSSVSLSGYLSDLIQELKYALGATHATFNLSSEIDKLPIESTISLGLILNELVTNSVKYASGSESLQVSIAVRKREAMGQLEYQDNGKNFVAESFNKSGTFGARLISIQSRQLNGKYSISNANGFNFMLSFPITSS